MSGDKTRRQLTNNAEFNPTGDRNVGCDGIGKFSKVSNSATIKLEREAKRNKAIRYFTHSYNNLLGLLNVDS